MRELGPLATLLEERSPRIVRAEVIEDGRALAVVLQETDGTGSAIRISVDQLAD